jgi:peptide deformylase
MLEIITFPNPILKQKCRPVNNPTDLEIKQLITKMTTAMRAHDGLGLAAPQIGQNIQLFLTEIDNKLMVFINPKIQKLSGKEVRAEEGCLSFPGKYLPIIRPSKVKIKFTNAEGERQILKTDGLLARAIQHEFDHLNGILFTEKADDLVAIG